MAWVQQALDERDLRIRALEEQNSLANAAVAAQQLPDTAVRLAEEAAQKLQQELLEKQAQIERLEQTMAQSRHTLNLQCCEFQ